MTLRSGRPGLSDPDAFFEGLRPARQACTEQLRRLRPSGPDHHMMFVIISAMDAAAEYFTKQRGFYTVGRQPDMIGRQAPPAEPPRPSGPPDARLGLKP